MRAVLDTNVLVRATKSATGPARELLMAFDSDEHVLVLSPYILTELLRVLNYDRMRRIHGLTPQECQDYVDSLQRAAEVVDVSSAQEGEGTISSDPDDDPILRTATDGRAEVICTRDRHFREPRVQTWCSQHGIRVLSDVELLALMRGNDGAKPGGGDASQ